MAKSWALIDQVPAPTWVSVDWNVRRVPPVPVELTIRTKEDSSEFSEMLTSDPPESPAVTVVEGQAVRAARLGAAEAITAAVTTISSVNIPQPRVDRCVAPRTDYLTNAIRVRQDTGVADYEFWAGRLRSTRRGVRPRW